MKSVAKKSGLPRRPSRLGLAETERLCRSTGISLMEEIVVIAIIAMFVVLGVPAIRAFVKSFESGSSARAMISASLSSARAIAAKEQHYAGIRFQNKYQADGKGSQYMIFIVYDSNLPRSIPGNLGCRAVEGVEPIKLPDSVGVMEVIGSNSDIDDDDKVADKTTFSIVFSPSGKLVIHELWVRNRDGDSGNGSKDDIFNIQSNVENGIGVFFQDESSGNRQIEPSRKSFIIYDRKEFEKLAPAGRYTGYLKFLADNAVIYINPYTGTMINK